MIGFLSGQVKSSQPGKIILDINGVGFLVNLPTSLNPTPGSKLDLHIHTQVKEDDISLYGFPQTAQMELFRHLISVSGIGPKIALTVLSVGTPDQTLSAIKASNVDFFTAIPGIGKKGAQRLIIELKNKFDQTDLDISSFDQGGELVEALSSLGFKKAELSSIIIKVDPSLPLEKQVKQALKLLHR